MKVNKYQRIILMTYGIAFIYLSIIHVPFKIKRDSEIVYDTLFSNRANVDFSRLSLVIIITTLISGLLFLVVRNLRVTFKLKPIPKLKPTFYILVGITIIAVSAFLLIQKYGSSFSLNKTAKKIDSTSVTAKSDNKIQTSLPILDTISQIDIPPFLKNKYLYNGKIFDFADIQDAAKQSHLDVEAYIKKAGIVVIDEEGLPISRAILKKYKTPNGKIVDESVLRKKYGNRFDELVSNGTFTVHEFGQVKKVKMIFPDGTIKDIEEADIAVAKSLGGKIYIKDTNQIKIKMIFPDGSIGDIAEKDINDALKAGAKRLY